MKIYETTESGLSFLIKTLLEYQEPCFFLFGALGVLLAASLFSGRRFRSAFLWPLLMLAVSVFNPYVFPLFLRPGPEVVEQYYRFLWCVPVPLLIGGGCAIIVFRVRPPWLKVLLYTVPAALILFFGTYFTMSGKEMTLPSNLMKADEELVALCDYIFANTLTDSPLVAFEDERLAEEAPAYDPSIRISDFFVDEEGESRKPRDLEASGEDFIVVRADGRMERAVKRLDYKLVGRTKESCIYAGKNQE